MVERKRGRAGQAQRVRRLALHPLCAHCLAGGITRATDFIDHITPLQFGGLDVDSNTQGLCALHHAIKSAMEGSGHLAASNHPDWLRHSAIALTIVTGPPCAGKSTYVAANAELGDTVIDLDIIAGMLQPGWRRQWSGDLLNRSIRVRNAALGALARATRGKAWFIVGAPTAKERAWWQAKLGGDLVRLDPGPAVCLARARTLGRSPGAVTEFYRASKAAWAPKAERLGKAAVGVDGYPL